MTIQFRCGGCGQEFQVPDAMAGSQASCNRCQQIVTVPYPASQQAGAPAALDAELISDSSPSAPLDPLGAGPLGAGPLGGGPLGGGPLGGGPLGSAPDNAWGTPAAPDGFGSPKRSNTGLWIALGVGGALVALLLLVALIVWVRLSDNGQPPVALEQAPLEQPTRTQPPPRFTPSRPTPSRPRPGIPRGQGGSGLATPPASQPFGSTDDGGKPGDDSGGQTPAGTAATGGSGKPAGNSGGEAPEAAGTDPADFARRAAEALSRKMREESSFTGNAGSSSGGKPSGPALAATPQLAEWTAQPDPPGRSVTFKSGKLEVELPRGCEVLYPRCYSKFALASVGSFKDAVRQVVDLETAKPIGKPIEGKLDGRDFQLSQDGQHLAAYESGAQPKLLVWSFATGEAVSEIPLERHLDRFTFGAANYAVVLGAEGNTVQIKVFDVRPLNGREIRDIKGPETEYWKNRWHDEQFAVSHGGRYLALIVGEKLYLVDLVKGESAGEAPLPNKPTKVHGLAFSPSGEELAALVEIESGAQLVCWDVAKGELSLEHQYFESLGHTWYRGPVLDWVPDGSALVLQGHTLVDRQCGAAFWQLPRTDAIPRRMLAVDRILVMMDDSRRRQRVLVAEKLPKKDQEELLATVRSGGTMLDAVLPPLSTPNLFSARQLALPSAAPQWAVQSDSRPAAAAYSEEDLLVAPDNSNVRAVAFASPETARLVVLKESSGTKRRYFVERFDLKSGRRGNQLEVPEIYQLLAASPSGDHALVGIRDRTSGGFNRIDVLSIAPEKHVAGWRPYEDVENKDHRSVTWATMLDDEHVLTNNAAGRLILWKMPDCQAVYVSDEFGEVLATSPGRRYLAVVQNDTFRIFESASGACVGELENPGGTNAIRGAFAPGGGEFAAVLEGQMSKMLVRWNLSDGSVGATFPIHPEAVSSRSFHRHFSNAQNMVYLDDQFVLLDSKYLLDLEKQVVIWRYHLPMGTLLADTSPDGRVWLLGRQGGGLSGAQYLAALQLPSLQTKGKLEFAQIEDQLVLHPGMKVRLNVQVSAGGISRGDIEQALTLQLKQMDVEVDPAAGVTLSVGSKTESTGTTLVVRDSPAFGFGGSPFSRYRPQPGDQTIQQQRMVCVLTLSDASGKIRWKRESGVSMRSGGSIDASNAAGKLQQEMQDNFANFLRQGAFASSIPMYVFGQMDEILAGESSLTLRGEGPPPPKKQPAPRR